MLQMTCSEGTVAPYHDTLLLFLGIQYLVIRRANQYLCKPANRGARMLCGVGHAQARILILLLTRTSFRALGLTNLEPSSGMRSGEGTGTLALGCMETSSQQVIVITCSLASATFY